MCISVTNYDFLRYVHIGHLHSHHRIYVWLISRTLKQLYAKINLGTFYDSGSVRMNSVYVLPMCIGITWAVQNDEFWDMCF